MSITNAQINGALITQAQKDILVACNSGSVPTATINACNISLADKLLIDMVENGSPTRMAIMASECSEPVKEILLAIAGL